MNSKIKRNYLKMNNYDYEAFPPRQKFDPMNVST